MIEEKISPTTTAMPITTSVNATSSRLRSEKSSENQILRSQQPSLSWGGWGKRRGDHTHVNIEEGSPHDSMNRHSSLWQRLSFISRFPLFSLSSTSNGSIHGTEYDTRPASAISRDQDLAGGIHDDTVSEYEVPEPIDWTTASLNTWGSFKSSSMEEEYLWSHYDQKMEDRSDSSKDLTHKMKKLIKSAETSTQFTTWTVIVSLVIIQIIVALPIAVFLLYQDVTISQLSDETHIVKYWITSAVMLLTAIGSIFFGYVLIWRQRSNWHKLAKVGILSVNDSANANNTSTSTQASTNDSIHGGIRTNGFSSNAKDNTTNHNRSSSISIARPRALWSISQAAFGFSSSTTTPRHSVILDNGGNGSVAGTSSKASLPSLPQPQNSVSSKQGSNNIKHQSTLKPKSSPSVQASDDVTQSNNNLPSTTTALGGTTEYPTHSFPYFSFLFHTCISSLYGYVSSCFGFNNDHHRHSINNKLKTKDKKIRLISFQLTLLCFTICNILYGLMFYIRYSYPTLCSSDDRHDIITDQHNNTDNTILYQLLILLTTSDVSHCDSIVSSSNLLMNSSSITTSTLYNYHTVHGFVSHSFIVILCNMIYFILFPQLPLMTVIVSFFIIGMTLIIISIVQQVYLITIVQCLCLFITFVIINLIRLRDRNHFIMIKRLQGLVMKTNEENEESHANEMRHMIANVAHDLKTVSSFFFFVYCQ